MECLKDYIGLLPNVDPNYTPPSGIFVNALPGIQADLLSYIADSEQETGVNVWNDVQKIAGLRLYTDAIAKLKKCYNFPVELEGDDFTETVSDIKYENIICSNKKLFASAWLFLLGNQLMIEALGSSRVNGYTVVDRTKLEELRDFYQVQYENQLKTILDSFAIDNSKVKASGFSSHVSWLP